jgi:inhibitor of KinA sporulation pathway (predicted exonuclease)
MKYLAILDFEATCDDRNLGGDWDITKQEIIEFPVALLDIELGRVVDEFHTFVRPMVQPQLTAFCTGLTSICQDQVDGQPTISEVAERFEAWCQTHGLNEKNCLMVTCGDWDLRRMWTAQVGLQPNLKTPAVFRYWCNIKKVFSGHMNRKATGMMGMLGIAGLEHIGQHHLGIDDVRNLCRVAQWLLERGVPFEASWGPVERAAEYAVWTKKHAKLKARISDKERALQALPAHAGVSVGLGLEQELQDLKVGLEPIAASAQVFCGD